MSDLINMVTVGLCTGFGSAVGTYFANKHLIEKIEHFDKRLKDNIAKPAQQKTPIVLSEVQEISKTGFETILEQAKKSKTL